MATRSLKLTMYAREFEGTKLPMRNPCIRNSIKNIIRQTSPRNLGIEAVAQI